jgi:hypothetical protein
VEPLGGESRRNSIGQEQDIGFDLRLDVIQDIEDIVDDAEECFVVVVTPAAFSRVVLAASAFLVG